MDIIDNMFICSLTYSSIHLNLILFLFLALNLVRRSKESIGSAPKTCSSYKSSGTHCLEDLDSVFLFFFCL